MHSVPALKSFLTLVTLAFLIRTTSSYDTDHSLSKRVPPTIRPIFQNVSPGLRDEVTVSVFSNSQQLQLEQIGKAPWPSPDPPDNEIDVDDTPILDPMVDHTLPFRLEKTFTPLIRKRLREDPFAIWFRLRKKLEEKEKYETLFDYARDIDEDSSSSATATTTTVMPPGNWKSRIDSVISVMESRMSKTATSTNEAQAYATAMVKDFLLDAVSHLPTITIAATAAEETRYTYETRMTSYSSWEGVDAFETSYLVLQAVETGSAPLSGTTTVVPNPTSGKGTRTTSVPSSTLTSSTGGAGMVDIRAAATLGLVGLGIQFVFAEV